MKSVCYTIVMMCISEPGGRLLLCGAVDHLHGNRLTSPAQFNNIAMIDISDNVLVEIISVWNPFQGAGGCTVLIDVRVDNGQGSFPAVDEFKDYVRGDRRTAALGEYGDLTCHALPINGMTRFLDDAGLTIDEAQEGDRRFADEGFSLNDKVALGGKTVA